MIWFGFTAKRVGPLAIIDGTMNTEKYLKTIETHFLPLKQDNGSIILQEDNAPCHKSKASKLYKEENGIHTLDWVPYSPDLNPIENLFAMLKKKIAKKMKSNKSELIQSIRQVWQSEISQEYCKNLIESMKRRIERVIEVNGGHTKY